MDQAANMHTNPERQERYVEQLASVEEYPPGDYWVSFEDAARIAKIYGKTVQNWVKSGKLAVRPQTAGISRRTRQVRVSDLAKLTPIIDASAAITTPAGNVYLASIPDQMFAIAQDHQLLMTAVQELEGNVLKHQQTMRLLISELRQQQEQEVKRLHDTLATQLTHVQDHLLAQITLITQQQEQNLERLREEFSTHLVQAQSHLQAQLQVTAQQQEQDVEQLRGELTRQVTQVQDHVRTQLTLLAQQQAQGAEQLREELTELLEQEGSMRERAYALLDSRQKDQQMAIDKAQELWHTTHQEFEHRFREAHQQLAQKYVHLQVLLDQDKKQITLLTQASEKQAAIQQELQQNQTRQDETHMRQLAVVQSSITVLRDDLEQQLTVANRQIQQLVADIAQLRRSLPGDPQKKKREKA